MTRRPEVRRPSPEDVAAGRGVERDTPDDDT